MIKYTRRTINQKAYLHDKEYVAVQDVVDMLSALCPNFVMRFLRKHNEKRPTRAIKSYAVADTDRSLLDSVRTGFAKTVQKQNRRVPWFVVVRHINLPSAFVCHSV